MRPVDPHGRRAFLLRDPGACANRPGVWPDELGSRAGMSILVKARTVRSCDRNDATSLGWREREIHEALADLGSIVYFARHLGYIKIGTTGRLTQRRSHLGFSWADLLAIIPGDRAVEKAHHERFAAFRVDGDGLGREHFAPAPALMDYINGLRTQMGVSEIAA